MGVSTRCGRSRTTGTPIAEGCLVPAAHPLVLCVGATTREDAIAVYSNLDGRHPRYLVAPGGDGTACEGRVLSTYPAGFQGDFFTPLQDPRMCLIDFPRPDVAVVACPGHNHDPGGPCLPLAAVLVQQGA